MTLSFFEDVDFDDGPPTEAHPRGRGRRGRRGGGDDERPPGAPGRGMPAGRRRLLVAVAALIVVVVVGWYWISACQADAQRRAYENYVTDVNSLVKQSDDIGAKLDNAILDPTATKKKLIAEVQAYATSQSAITTSTAQLHDTGRLRGLQPWLDTTMRYRTQGLQGMATALDTALSTKLVPVSAVANVSDAYERLLASDVLYSDSFHRPAQAALAKANVNGVSISNSVFALTPHYVVPTYLRSLLQRVVSNGSSTPANTSGAAVGTELYKVEAEPSGKQLIPGSSTITSVPASTDLTFKVSIKNSGDVPVTKVQVRFVEQNLAPQTQTIKFINPGGIQTVSFTPKNPTLGIPTKLVVRSVGVPHEKNLSNNTATYQVEYAG
ncbi:MAG: CARDB domain-containing protein [Gaiellales bacterium]